MKKIFTYLLVIPLMIQLSIGQEKRTTPDGNYEGVIRIKFKPELVSTVDALSEKLSTTNKLKASPQVGYVQTGIQTMDAVNRTYQAVNMKRIFRPAGRYEARHRKHGLHLWYEIEFNSKEQLTQLLSAYQNLAEVEVAEPKRVPKMVDYKITSTTSSTKTTTNSLSSAPNDPLFGNQWHYKNTGQNGGTPGCDISLLEAWTIETGNSNVIVAIEDGGVDWDHEDLAGNMWVNPGEIPGNGVDDDNNGYVDDVYGYNFADNTGTIYVGDHGTHVAGTVAAETNNGIGVAGVAGGSGNNDGVRLMSCNVFGQNVDGFEEAYTYAADNGAVISQNSWGYTSKDVYDQALLDAIDYFIAEAGGQGQAMNGGLVIFAAGNDDSSGQWWPGCYDKVLSVAATNCKDEKAWYSNYDTWVDISAPGGELISSNTDPTAIHSTLPNNQYGVMQGTSMACPHVSGVAALIVSKYYGNITPSEVWNKLVSTTDNIDATIPTYLGKMGSGRMNAYTALNDGQAPSTPTGLTAINVKANSFTLQWNAASGASSYDVQIRQSGGNWSTYSASTNSYEYTGANPETTYEFQVRAVNSNGTSAYTSVGNVTTPALPPLPAVPDGLYADNILHNGFTLHWNSAANADTYDLQVRPQGGTWTNYSAATTSFVVTGKSPETTYEYHVRATNETGSSNYSATETVTTTTTPISYCTSQGNNSTYEWIAKVEIGSYVNTSGSAGYTDFTSQVVNLNTNTDYNITLTPGFQSTTYSEYWKIWIDYNRDGVFNDAEELAFDAGSMSKSAVTGTISVPANVEGTTRLRVSMKYNGAQTACESFSYGEVEDYTVNIQAGTITPPATPDGLTSGNLTSNSFTLNWNSVATADSYDVQIRATGGSWSTYQTTGTSYNFSSLIPATTYECQVRANNSAGSSSYSSALSVTTLNETIEYCTSQGSNTSYEWIDLVQLGSINNTSGNDGGYQDYTNMVTDLAPGSSQTIYFSAGFKSSSYTEYWHVWIDFNHNGTFESSERVAYGSSSSSGTLSGDFTVPSDATLGQTRMRVTMKYNGAADACESFTYGEVEDYTVNITNTAQAQLSLKLTTAEKLGMEQPQDIMTIYPNPADKMVTISTNQECSTNLRLLNTSGVLIQSVPMEGNRKELDVSNLAGGIYFIILETERDRCVKKLIKK